MKNGKLVLKASSYLPILIQGDSGAMYLVATVPMSNKHWRKTSCTFGTVLWRYGNRRPVPMLAHWTHVGLRLTFGG